MDIDTTILVGEDRGIYDFKDFVVDDWGNKYVLGAYTGSVNIGGHILTSNLSNHWEARAVYLTKYNAHDNLIWAKKVVQGDTLFMPSLYINGLGQPHLVYSFYGSIRLSDGDTVFSKGLLDIAVEKLDSAGNSKSLFQIGSTQMESCEEREMLTFDNNGNFYLFGSFNTNSNGMDSLQLGTNILSSDSNGNYDVFVVKIDSQFNLVWAKSFGGIGWDEARSISFLNNRLYLLGVLGHFQNNNIGGVNLTLPQNYIRKGFIAQLDTAGNGIWARHFGSNPPDLVSSMNPRDIAVCHNRIYFTVLDASNTQNRLYFQGGPPLISHGPTTDYAIAAYDTLGNFKWNILSKSAGGEYLASLDTDSSGNLYGIGKYNFNINFPNDTLLSYQGDDVLVLSYDSNGVYRYAFGAGGSGADIGSDIKLNTQGKIYIVGGTTSNPCYMGNDTLYPSLNQSTLFYARIDSIANLSTNVNVHELSTTDWTVYPNPAESVVYVQVAEKKQNTIEEIIVYDMVGREVGKKKLGRISSSLLPIDLSQLSEGIYLLTLKTKENTSSRRIMIQ